jgi:hypothetical protein
MKHQETKSSIIFRHWIKANPLYTCALEMKDTRGKNNLAFSEVKQAQRDFGMAIKSDKGVMIRVEPIVEGYPDYIYLRNEPAYVPIKYPKCICIIDIETFILEDKRSKKRRSLTCARAKDIAIKVIEL